MDSYHITYRTRDGRIEVGRIAADSRPHAITWAAERYGVRRTSVQSAVKLPRRREV